eukprot:436917-Rhodomonas_salina.1
MARTDESEPHALASPADFPAAKPRDAAKSPKFWPESVKEREPVPARLLLALELKLGTSAEKAAERDAETLATVTCRRRVPPNVCGSEHLMAVDDSHSVVSQVVP